MLFNLKEFESLEEYNRWITLNGERVQVISMTTLRNRWMAEGDSIRPVGPLYLVTFREIVAPEAAPEEVRCDKCGADNAPGFKFCGDCGTPLHKPE